MLAAMSSKTQGLQSLSGVLHTVQKGAFGLRQKKKSWFFFFDEKKCQLKYYKAQKKHLRVVEPAGSIDIGNSSLSFDPRQQGLFVIHSEGKDYWLMADSHDNMMHWLKALQVGRAQWKKEQDAAELALIKSNRSTSTVSLAVEEFGDSSLGHGVLAETRAHKKKSHSAQNLSDRTEQPRLHPLIKLQALSAASIDSGIDGSESMNSIKTGASANSQTEDQDSHLLLSADLASKYLVVDEDYFGSSSSSVFPSSSSLQLNTATPESEDTRDKQLFQPGAFDKSTHVDAAANDSAASNAAATPDCGLLSLNSPLKEEVTLDEVFSSDATVKLPAEGLAIINTLKEELRETRAELTRLRRHKMAYSHMLSSQDKSLSELEDNLECTYQTNINRVRQSPVNEQIKLLEEECRAYKQQNAFLSNELIQLFEQKQQEFQKHKAINKKQRSIEEKMCQLKLNYVGIIEKSIKDKKSYDETTEDLADEKACQHLFTLLKDAHNEAPKRIPVFECCEGCHVDEYGHVHDWQNEVSMQHYLCRLLSVHYKSRLQENDHHMNRWQRYVWENKEKLQRGQFDGKTLKQLVRDGIPNCYRELVWKSMVTSKVGKLIEEKGVDYYSHLCHSQTSSIKQIKLDLLRTLPNNKQFGRKSRGVEKLERVLVAYSLHNPTVGYCQGMNMIAAVCLFYLSEEDAFWCLVYIIECLLPANYYTSSLVAAMADQEVLKEMLTEKLPDLARIFSDSGIEFGMITFNWFMTLFVDPLPIEAMLRAWDCFLLTGPKILFRIAVAVFKINRKDLLQLHDPISLLGHLKLMSRLMFNGDLLLQTAFDLGKFYQKSHIDRRRDAHMAVLTRSSQRTRVGTIRDPLSRAKSIHDSSIKRSKTRAHQLVWECAVVSSQEVVWLCQGSHESGRLAALPLTLDPELAFVEYEFASRLTCIAELNSDIILVGTLSWALVAFSATTGLELWSLMLTDSPVSLACSVTGQTYVGLADGSIAYFEELNQCMTGEPQNVTLQDGLPVMCLLLANEQDMWCGCGNMIFVLNAQSFEEHGCWKAETEVRRSVAKLALGKHGIWSSARGSSLIKLWHAQSYENLLEYDCATVLYQGISSLQQGAVKSTHLSPGRITALNIACNTVWVGTGGGWIITFNIQDKVAGYCSLHPLMTHRISEEAVRCIVSSTSTRELFVLTCPNQGLCMLWHPEEDEKTSGKVKWQSVQVMSSEQVLNLKSFLYPNETDNSHGEIDKQVQTLVSSCENVDEKH